MLLIADSDSGELGVTSPMDSAGQSANSDDASLLALFDVLGRRWALRILWELGRGGATYRDLAARVPEMSTSTLTQRLRDLRDVRLVDHERGAGYVLTPLGAELLTLLAPLGEWSERAGFAAASPPV